MGNNNFFLGYLKTFKTFLGLLLKAVRHKCNVAKRIYNNTVIKHYNRKTDGLLNEAVLQSFESFPGPMAHQ